jgi:hypothetical protein
LAHVEADDGTKPNQATDVWGNVAICAVSIVVRHTKFGINYYRLLKVVWTERRYIKLSTATLGWYLTLIVLTFTKSSLRKGLNKTEQLTDCRNSFKAYKILKENTAKRNERGKTVFWCGNRMWANLLLSSAKHFLTQWTVLQITYNGPFNVTRPINPPTYEVANGKSEITTDYSQNAIKLYIYMFIYVFYWMSLFGYFV